METITLPKIYSKEEYLNLEEKCEFKSMINVRCCALALKYDSAKAQQQTY
jgi:hypothetical protein